MGGGLSFYLASQEGRENDKTCPDEETGEGEAESDIEVFEEEIATMAEENKIRDAADAIKGVAEAVPIYPDLLQPAVKELGKGLQTITKTVLIALAPFEITVWGYEKIKGFLSEEIPKRLANVPEERIISPKPSIAGPTIEALRFAANEPSLREMYANLLATSMDVETAQNAHPAFVEMIRQMTSDEARIIEFISLYGFIHVYEFSLLSPFDSSIFSRQKYIPKAKEAVGLVSSLIPSYLDNLHRLGLISVQFASDYERLTLLANGRTLLRGTIIHSEEMSDDEINEFLHSSFKNDFEWQDGDKMFNLSREEVSFSALGAQFSSACIAPVYEYVCRH
jgi:hypothetical protein